MGTKRLLTGAAVILFIFAAFGFNPFGLDLIPLGFALWVGSSFLEA